MTDDENRIHQMVKNVIEFNKPAYVCIVDLTKAPNRVVKEVNIHNIGFVRAEKRVMKELPIHTSIRQGDNLSPIFFNVVKEETIKKSKQQKDDKEWEVQK